MASEFSGQIDIDIRLRRIVAMALSEPWERAQVLLRHAINDGGGVNEARYFYASRRPISGGTGDDINLRAVTNRLGSALVYSTLRALIVHNRSTEPDELCKVAGDVMSVIAGDFLHSIVVRPGGTLVLLAPRDGYTIGEFVANTLSIEAPDEDIEIDLLLVGS